MIRRFPNGETRLSNPQASYNEYIVIRRNTRGTETSKYPEEEKEKSIFLVAASERERGQTESSNTFGVADCIRDSKTLAEVYGKTHHSR